MVDTMKLRSPVVDEVVGAAIQERLDLLYRSEIATGDLRYVIIAGSLAGSFDHSISLRYDELERRLVMEGSVHKAILGHNVSGGPECPSAAGMWFVDLCGRLCGVDLPEGRFWEVLRVDWARVADVGHWEGAVEALQLLSSARYPRRKPNVYAGESVTFRGAISTVKVYHKGPEFAKHDSKRLRKHLDQDSLEFLQIQANRLVRTEIEVRARKLKEKFGRFPTVVDLEAQWLENLLDRELETVQREGKADMERVRTAHAVRQRLISVYGERAARSLFGTWTDLATSGEEYTRTILKRRTFYLHRKQLVEAGCDWKGSDVHLVDRFSHVPADFSLRSSSPYILRGEAPEVSTALSGYRAA